MKELNPMALICPILDKRWQMMLSYLLRQLFYRKIEHLKRSEAKAKLEASGC